MAAEGMTGFKDALSWKERCGEGARAFLQAAFFCTLSAHITTYHNRCTIIHSDTTQVDQDLLQFPVAQEILRCFPVATCFSLSQTFTIMAYSSGATLTCQNFMNFVIYAYLIYLRSLRNMCVCVRIFIPMILPSAYLSDVPFLEMFGAFWSLFDFVTRYSHVLGQWNGEHGPLQHCSFESLDAFKICQTFAAKSSHKMSQVRRFHQKKGCQSLIMLLCSTNL